MKWIGWPMLLLAAIWPWNAAFSAGWRNNSNDVHLVNTRLKGKVIDHTANHGKENRMWSQTLYQRRDLYVYLPPGYTNKCRYPLIYFLHPACHDEQFFLHVVEWFDTAIADGKLPPVVIAVPDGTVQGYYCAHEPNTFFLNSSYGDFQDYVINDIWDFMIRMYSIRPERGAHVLFGYSMGGYAAYNIGLQHRDCFGVVVGIFPPLNMRWENKSGHYMADFDPMDWGWASQINKVHLTTGFYHMFRHPFDVGIRPGFGHSPMAIQAVSEDNPIEMVDRTSLRHGQLEMYVAYGGCDEFNVDAQVDSFLYLLKFRGIGIGVGYSPHGRHNLATAHSLFPGIVEWLTPRLAPYSPMLGTLKCENN